MPEGMSDEVFVSIVDDASNLTRFADLNSIAGAREIIRDLIAEVDRLKEGWKQECQHRDYFHDKYVKCFNDSKETIDALRAEVAELKKKAKAEYDRGWNEGLEGDSCVNQ